MKADPNYKGMTGLLSNIRCKVTIQSIPATAFPDIKLTDTDIESLIKTLDVQWGGDRKQLEVLLSLDGSNWQSVGAVSLINSGGYPYYTIRLMDHITDDTAYEMGEGAAVGVQLRDVGTGLLGEGDHLVIHGNYVEEFTLLEPQSSIGNITTPDLTTVETAITSLSNQIANLQTTVDVVQTDLADDPELSDINALSTKIDAIQLSEGGGVIPSTSKAVVITDVTAAEDKQLLWAAADINDRVKVVIHNDSPDHKVLIQFGDESGAAFTPAFPLDEHSGVIEESWKGAIRAKCATGTATVTVTEFKR
ncbi:MAG: hypothetical protein F6J87_26280 [Spirulina sp. SIO3F2]|nr:hypothetical protein [Spirulina sp. SIO3F2]